MAGVNRELDASSLMEVVVSIVIISIISSVSLMIYLNTMRTISNGKKYQMETAAQYYLDTYVELTKERKQGFLDESGHEIQIDLYETEWKNLQEVVLTLSDSLQSVTIVKRKLIYQPE